MPMPRPHLPAFDDHPGSAPGQILQRLLGQFLGVRLTLGILAADLGDGNEPGVSGAIDHSPTTVAGQFDGPFGYFDCAEAQFRGSRHEDAAVLLDDRRLQQGAAGIGQYVAPMEQIEFLLENGEGIRAEVPKPNFQ